MVGVQLQEFKKNILYISMNCTKKNSVADNVKKQYNLNGPSRIFS